ncbi:MAG TPA: bifunctional [glutamate--ammonia ligase]-adenylyl-L-tyrosine phosphorylase/[glutamate--ammonia-ligase] adenylyltransferase [Gammaproteobacteria bacterium]|nr:bifunctional [glutamate--ammonia ligase]-adenylyl-L-tyrosine phosphorylase/[glutamate--ammonia-ligase] adenylyltransferase [Gammaproteobacteria bacterium]
MPSLNNNLKNLPPALHERVARYWETYQEAAHEHKVRPVSHPDVLNVLYRVWAYSDFVAENCARNPQLLGDLLQSGDLLADYAAQEYAHKLARATAKISDEAALNAALRETHQRETVRIAWRDLAGWADLAETLADTSALAEACIDAALAKLHAWQVLEYGVPCDAGGVPQSLVVLGMGKLGARELNFSSDIDLIFAYPGEGETRGRRPRISNEEYFVRLAQKLINSLAATTEQGIVYRVDMRLRPFGDSGPLALSFSAMEDYYQTHGREWERYALIKARAVAGDQHAGQLLMTTLRPFIYRRYLDFGAFESLRNMKEMINQETRRKGLEDNIKLGEGGIREVEFIAQVFQLIRGGRVAQLQEPGTRTILERLSQANYLPGYVSRELLNAYQFLRRVENRLQEVADQQTHNLPGDEIEQIRLALAMGYPTWDGFMRALDKQRTRVHAHFEQIFAAPQAQSQQHGNQPASANIAGLWQQVLDAATAGKLLSALGYADAPEALRLLTQLRAGHSYQALSTRGRERMDTLMPLLIAAAAQSDEPNISLARLVNLIEAIAQRSTYLALLSENPLGLSQLVKLCAASPWISALLTRHPLLLDELLDPRTLYAPLDKPGLEAELRQSLMRIPQQDLEQQMEALRHFKQVHVLRVAAADTAGVLPLMKVSDHLTAIAEVVLRQVLHLAWQYLVSRHGAPACKIGGKSGTPGFAIIAYGKLGGIELGYGSDLDIVFLHGNQGEGQFTAGPKSVDNSVFFARLGQRIIHILNAHTPAGVLYEVDTRLRPSGASGLLVSSLESFAGYQRNQAWTWEHQALVRARPVAEIDHSGGAMQASIAEQFTRLRREILGRHRERESLRAEVRAMREKMYTALGQAQPGRFDIKHDRGGIADIEFMVQYGVLLWAYHHPELLVFPDNIRLLQALADAGLMAMPDAQLLSDAYRAYRSAVHRFALQDEPAYAGEEEFRDYREGVSRIWQELIEKQ